ncbi:hypothetical protein Fmac_007802 [Flemingia macrophylla]|uniref:Uncharacterized protein n=1 Tax=Flemingia macrophylla TaxID=520843 RepID=A0ABD1MVM0_9FABA
MHCYKIRVRKLKNGVYKRRGWHRKVPIKTLLIDGNCRVADRGLKTHHGHIPVKAFSFENSEVISRAYCDSSKPSRSTASERWVLHSTAEYAEDIIAETGLKKPSEITLNKVAEQLFQEFQRTGHNISQLFFKKAHRWVPLDDEI